MKVYTVIQVFQGEPSIKAQGTDKDKVWQDYLNLVNRWKSAGYSDNSEVPDSKVFVSNNLHISFLEEDIE